MQVCATSATSIGRSCLCSHLQSWDVRDPYAEVFLSESWCSQGESLAQIAACPHHQRMSTPVDTASRLFQMVERDPGLAVDVRQAALNLWAKLSATPDLALDELTKLSLEVAGALPREPTTMDLGRCVSVDVFWRFHLAPDVKAFFVTPEEYSRYLQRAPIPQDRLEADFDWADVAFPQEHSWVCRWEQIEPLDANATRRALGLPNKPPYIVFRLDGASLVGAGVTIRPARSVDAVIGLHTEWDAAGPSPGMSEYVDGDVPSSVVEEIRWRP